MMRLAFLILCHKNPTQINHFIKFLTCNCIDFYIHVDKKSNIVDDIDSKSNVFLIPDEKRVNVKWATYSQIQAELTLLNTAHNKGYDYYWLVSGQDYPLASSVTIIKFLQSNLHCNYISVYDSENYGDEGRTNYDKRHEIYFPNWILSKHLVFRIIRRLWIELTGGYKHTYKVFRRRDFLQYKYYYGSQWWCINRYFLDYMQIFLNKNPNYINCFKNTSCPDESFFQTILMNSDFRKDRKDYLHYIEWNKGSNSPKSLTQNDLDKAFKSNKLMARKIDLKYDRHIIDEMNKRITSHL